MPESMNLCFDLGSDSLKVSFCKKENGRFSFGKIVEDDYLSPTTISSNAFYSTKEKRWLFGVEADKVNDPRYLHFVNIKKMLSLLIMNRRIANNAKQESIYKEEDYKVFQSNKDYYFNKNYFPYFFFPDGKEYDNKFDFKEKVLKKDVFLVDDYTPSRLCEDYFEFVKSICDKVLLHQGLNGTNYSISVVYPLRAGRTYRQELVRLIENAFSKKICKEICQTKALTILAKYQGKIQMNDNFLVFDIGNEDISVAKASYSYNGSIFIEGRDGHNDPLSVGGNNIDEEIATYLTNKYFNDNSIGGKSEAMLLSKQYLFLNSIKEAKYILSSDNLERVFPNGVPLNMYKDTIVSINYTENELKNNVGVLSNNSNSVANQIVDYISLELTRIVNRDVTKVFISGGVIETIGLFDYIKEKVFEKTNKRVLFYTFENSTNGKGRYEINDDNDSTYASCLGCNIISIDDIDIPVCLSLAYGTFLYDHGVRTLRFFDGANRGAELYKDKDREFALSSFISGPTKEEFFSVEVAEQQVRRRQVAGEYSINGFLVIYEPGSSQRRQVSKNIGLNIVAGGTKGNIELSFQGKQIVGVGQNQSIPFKEGIRVTPDGKAKPFIENTSPTTQTILVQFAPGYRGDLFRYVGASDIKISFSGVDQFEAAEEE